jgi:hypothetical protein
MAEVPTRRDVVAAQANVLVVTLLAVAVSVSAQGLAGVRRVSLAVDVQHAVDALSPEDLLARLEEGVRQAEPAMRVDEAATDRLRLVVSVRPVSATALRGFWLPFSGTYAIGSIALEVERLVTVPGGRHAFPAIVWQAERAVAGRWAAAPDEVRRLTDELIAEWLEAQRQVR